MQRTKRPTNGQRFSQPLDRVAAIVMLLLSVVIGVLLLSGSHTAPQVRSFTWQDKQVGAEDSAFILTFSRPMDHSSVEENLRLLPNLPGKFSWAGRQMAYTLETPAPYGTAFELEVQGARDRFSKPTDNNPIQPFVGRFRTRDRAFVYLGVTGEEAGRLVLENLTRQEHRILTPAELVVMDFEPYPEGDRILFSATDRASQERGSLNQQLYTVTTGISLHASADSPGHRNPGTPSTPPAPSQPPGTIAQLLDSKDYQNLKFDLSPNGEKIIVQRVNRQNPGDYGLWILLPNAPPQPLKTEPGGDFLIAPDSNSLAMAQGQGLAILPLESDAEPLDFLAKFGMILGFSKDGSTAATVQFTPDPTQPTRSLYLVNNQGEEKQLFTTAGSILSAQFAPTKRHLYCLVTQLLPNKDVFLEQPYLIAINLETAERTDLLKLPMQREIQMNLAPDGLGILFDQVISATASDSNPGIIQGQDGNAIATSRLWFFPIIPNQAGNPTQVQPEALPLEGLRPRWLP
jgi:hypothetical protein